MTPTEPTSQIFFVKMCVLGGWKRQKWPMNQKIDFFKVQDIDTPIQPRKKKHQTDVILALKTFQDHVRCLCDNSKFSIFCPPKKHFPWEISQKQRFFFYTAPYTAPPSTRSKNESGPNGLKIFFLGLLKLLFTILTLFFHFWWFFMIFRLNKNLMNFWASKFFRDNIQTAFGVIS